MSHSLRLGTRGSDLALWQARRVASMIEQRLGLSCSIEIIRTRGDRIQNVAFHKMEGKGFFTKELQDAMLEERVDLVVHSLKDLPTTEPEGLCIAAIPERHDPADLLLIHPDRRHQPRRDAHAASLLADGMVVGTSSLRRAAQILALEPSVEIRALRGNVPTRIDKLRRGDFDAILLAAAGVNRLGLELGDLEQHLLPASMVLPAPGQGALAVEARVDDPATACLGQLHDPEVARQVEAERGLLELIGGGCHVPLGCLATEIGAEIHLEAALGRVDEHITSARVTRVSARAKAPSEAARLCHEALLERTSGSVGEPLA